MKPDSHPADLDRLIDGEGTVEALAALEAHVAGCAACSAELAAKRKLSTMIRQHATRHTPSPAMQERWRRLAADTPPAAVEPAKIVPIRRPAPPRWLAMAASVALVAAMSAGSMHLIDRETAATDLLADEAVTDHVRSLAVSHLYDVESTDQHTVKPWFNGKLSFSPPVKDLAEQGFPLLGGRLDYLGRRQVAALVYRHSQHVINLFVWPDSASPEPVATGPTEQGYNTLHWRQDGMNFWAVSDVNQTDLQAFAAHFRD